MHLISAYRNNFEYKFLSHFFSDLGDSKLQLQGIFEKNIVEVSEIIFGASFEVNFPFLLLLIEFSEWNIDKLWGLISWAF